MLHIGEKIFTFRREQTADAGVSERNWQISGLKNVPFERKIYCHISKNMAQNSNIIDDILIAYRDFSMEQKRNEFARSFMCPMQALSSILSVKL